MVFSNLLNRISLFHPDELFFFLEAEAAKEAGKEERGKGYKVKVKYQPVKETDKQTKREAVAKVIIGALKRWMGSRIMIDGYPSGLFRPTLSRS